MAGFQTKKFAVHDDYMTPASAWHAIKDYIPKGKQIWEPFYGDGTSGKVLQNMGFNVVHRPVDFFEHDFGDVIVSNPPFSNLRAVLERLVTIGKPFILIMPTSKLVTRYLADIFSQTADPIQLLIPRRRIQFIKMQHQAPTAKRGRAAAKGSSGTIRKQFVKAHMENGAACNFDCFYYCWRLNLPRDIVWLP